MVIRIINRSVFHIVVGRYSHIRIEKYDVTFKDKFKANGKKSILKRTVNRWMMVLEIIMVLGIINRLSFI